MSDAERRVVNPGMFEKEVEAPSSPASQAEFTEVAHDDERGTSEAPEEYVPPNGGYGWVCTGCAFFINGHTWGINSVSIPLKLRSELSSQQEAYGVFLAHYLSNNTYPG